MTNYPKFHQTYMNDLIKSSTVTDEEFINKYRNRFPCGLITEWQNVGFCGFGQGFLWLVNPSYMEFIFTQWNLSRLYLPFGRTAFGDIFLWDGKNVYCLFVHQYSIEPITDDFDMFFEFALCDDPFLDEVLNRQMFNLALGKLGQLNNDEMYTYVPALALGGKDDVEWIKRVKMREQLLILSQIHRKQCRFH